MIGWSSAEYYQDNLTHHKYFLHRESITVFLSTVKRREYIMLRVFGSVALIVVIAAGIYVSRFKLDRPIEIIEQGTVEVASHHDPQRTVTPSTRRVRAGSLDYWEVELASNVWINCGGDCAEKYRRENLDFMQKRKEGEAVPRKEISSK
jgi:hypothetical protein